MELGVRDWMLIIGSLLILAVLLDGYRRMRNERRNGLRLSRKVRRTRRQQEEDDDDLPNPELPGGSARIVSVRERERGDLQLERDVPFVMDALEDAPGAPEPADVEVEDYPDPLFDEAPVRADPADRPGRRQQAPAQAERAEGAGRAERAGRAETPVPEQPAAEQTAPKSPEAKPPKEPEARKKRDESAPRGGAESLQELITLHVVARDQDLIRGPDLLQVLLACDVRYGRMNIFHRHEQQNGQGAEQFSVANLVEPGTFDLDAIDQFTTPGVIFFMHLPGPQEPMKAFECMVETANCLVRNLGLELRDEAHSVATAQTLEHYRQRIRDFERRQLTLV